MNIGTQIKSLYTTTGSIHLFCSQVAASVDEGCECALFDRVQIRDFVVRMRTNGGRAYMYMWLPSAGNWRAQDGGLSEGRFSPKQRKPGQAVHF